MLLELHVKNLAVVADASIELGPGLNVLTGETGAGKSIVVDSLMLLAGARASTDLIRTGAEGLTVTGVFQLAGKGWRALVEEAGLSAVDGELLVRRDISREGRNRVFVNDQPATASLLARLAPALLRIHGQREEMGLVDPDLQRVWLDRSGGAEAEALLARTGEAFATWRRLAERLEHLTGERRAVEERLDLLRFQAAEIDAAHLTPGEDEELRAERDVLRNLEHILTALGGSYSLLFDEEGAAVDRIARSQSLLEEVAGWELQAGDWIRELEELRIRLDEVTSGLRQRLDGLEADPKRLDQVEDRLALVERLCRKYGGGATEILEQRRRIALELEELEGDVADQSDLEARTAAAMETYKKTALELSVARGRWGESLARRMRDELGELGLGKARLGVALERRRREAGALAITGDGGPVEAGPQGIDQVVFLFSPNPGEAPRPLGRIASGGELSRIYLALQLAARAGETPGRHNTSPTLVFDEVDSGVSGAQAAALGRKLQRLAGDAQILAVTHLPQVASHADLHFRVSKQVRSGRTHTRVERLDTEARVREVARLLAGDTVTEVAEDNARELIASAARPVQV